MWCGCSCSPAYMCGAPVRTFPADTDGAVQGFSGAAEGPPLCVWGRARTSVRAGAGVPVVDPAVTPPNPILAGLAGRCPRCGKGKMFSGFLRIKAACETCGLDYSFVDAGDGPAVFVTLIAGFIVGGAALGVVQPSQHPFSPNP